MKAIGFIEEEFASASIARARKKYQHFEAYWDRGITWVLARNPTIGLLVPDTKPPRYAWGISPWRAGGIPKVVVVYRYSSPDKPILIERVTFYK